MGFLSRLVAFFGLILLAHAYATYLPTLFPLPLPSKFPPLSNQILTITLQKNNRGYSAHEHTLLYSNSSTTNPTALPLDIIIEALASLVLVSAGLVLGAEKLKPISWSEWAGQIEREGGGRNPYLRLEERYGFWDVRVSGSFLFFVPRLLSFGIFFG